MYRVPKREGARLFKYVAKVDIAFNPWDEKSNSTRELWRRLTSDRLSKSNPKAVVAATMPTDIPKPFTTIKYVDGSVMKLEDTSTMSVEEIISELNMAAAKIDNEWMMAGKELDDE